MSSVAGLKSSFIAMAGCCTVIPLLKHNIGHVHYIITKRMDREQEQHLKTKAKVATTYAPLCKVISCHHHVCIRVTHEYTCMHRSTHTFVLVYVILMSPLPYPSDCAWVSLESEEEIPNIHMQSE